MIPIFEDKDLFNGNKFTISENPLVNDLQETVQKGLDKGEINGIHFEDGYEYEYTAIRISEYNKFYIFDFLADKYPNYGFLVNDNGTYSLHFKGDFIIIRIEPPVIDIN